MARPLPGRDDLSRSGQARRLAGAPLLLLVLSIALVGVAGGCGEADSGSGPSGNGSGVVAGCLDPDEVREEVNRIAEGFETSSEEVEAKQQEIRAIEAEAC
jgi:hypothetical protein